MLACAADGQQRSDWRQCLPYPTFAEEVGGIEQKVDFVVEIRNVKLLGPYLPAEAAERIAASLRGLSMRMDDPTSQHWADELRERIRDAWQQRGFFKVAVGDMDVDVLDEATAHRTISATVHVDVGRQYRLATLQFRHNRPFTNTQLRAAFPIRSGEVFNTAKIREGLDHLRKLYSASGYINFTPVPNTNFDDRTRTIDLEVDIDAGDIYRLQSFVIEGVGQQRKLQLHKAFPLNSGDPINLSALEQFYRENAKDPQADPSPHISVKPNVLARTVDVTIDMAGITFRPYEQQCPWSTPDRGRD